MTRHLYVPAQSLMAAMRCLAWTSRCADRFLCSSGENVLRLGFLTCLRVQRLLPLKTERCGDFRQYLCIRQGAARAVLVR